VEDLAAPGLFRFDLDRGEAVLILAAPGWDPPARDAFAAIRSLRAAERRRRSSFPSRLHRAADDYIVRRGTGSTIVAGYPWFTDWGRDTFIALRGLALATGRLDAARDILLEWAGAVSDGMLPNRFPDQGDEPEFNAVDASLWYVIAVHDYLRGCAARGSKVPRAERARLAAAVGAILDGYRRGTRYGIRMDSDGLLAAGVEGVQLTWMDAKVGDWVVTPRIGKPVEVQALWINALRIGAEIAGRQAARWDDLVTAFRRRFWNEPGGFLHDVVDVHHVPGSVDPAFRPNQIFAVGGLPYPLLEGDPGRRVVDAVEARLWTPLGLRSLAPGEPGFTSRYEGGIRERDGAYHQGTVWPWLLGPFVEAWVRVRGGTAGAVREARERFLTPLLAHLDEAGLGHISEIADAEPPHLPRGCPFQAWSVGEALRLSEEVLAPGAAGRRSAGRRRKAEPPARARASLRP
jgi:predicted glycogen debranching enzyme